MSFTPGSAEHRVLPGSSVSGHVELRNLGTLPLSGIHAVVTGAAANLTVQVTAPNQLAAAATAGVDYVVTAANDSVLISPAVQIRLVSTEGAVAVLSLNITVASQAPRLVAAPTRLDAGMLRGAQKVVQFEVSNQGATATGDLTVALPAAPWLALATPAHIPSLTAGQKTTVALTLTPAATLPLGPYSG